MTFDKIIDGILAVEQGYVNHPSDRGGPTNFGVTEAVARANGYTGNMRDLPESFARKVYLKRYITDPRFDQVAAINEKIAEEMIDTGVNMGTKKAGEFLQRSLNAFNMGQRLGSDLVVDGDVGPGTLNFLKAFIAWRGQAGVTALYRALNSLQGTRYIEISEANKSQRDFTFGWFSNRVA